MSAEQDFRARAEEVARLLDEIAPGWWPERSKGSGSGGKPLGTSIAVVARSCLVLLVSYFEGFLKDLADEAFDNLLESGRSCDSLGDDFRGQLVNKHVLALRTSNEPKDLWIAVNQVTKLGSLLADSAPLREELIPREEVKRAVSSIEPTKINLLLRALNDQDLKNGPMSRHGLKLKGLKQIRDNAVHGNETDLPALGYRDVFENLELLTQCARDLQERVDALLAR